MNRKIKAIIFDLDGVICNTDHYHYLAWKKLCDEFNLFFDESINNRLRGISREESLNIILEVNKKQITDLEKEKLLSQKNDYYKALLIQMSEKDLDHTVLTTLNTLRKSQLKLAIGSSSKNAKFILSQLGITNYFDEISDGNGIKYSKPDPEVFNRAATNMNLQSQNCMIIEDAEAGIDAANQGGFMSVAIGDAVKCEKADFNISSFDQIITLITTIEADY